MPGCTSFASPPVFTEAMNQEIAVILPEQISILRRESMRQYVATLQGHIAGANVLRRGRGPEGGLFQEVPDGGTILIKRRMPRQTLIPG